jgi:hypothetical protein
MAMAEETLVVSSSTDGQQAVENAAQGTSEGVSVSESSLADFRESESSDGQTTTSYESPGSERNALLERLSEAEREIELLPEEPADDALPGNESTGLNQQERELLRQAALQDALEDARRTYRQQPAYSSPEEQMRLSEAELGAAREQWSQTFWDRMARAPDKKQTDQLFDQAIESGIGISDAVTDTLLAVDCGPEALVHLLKHPEERARLLRLPEHLAAASVADLAARLAQPPRRQRSNAPAPITPVSGSPTRSSLPLEDLSYQDYRAARERQIRAKRGR